MLNSSYRDDMVAQFWKYQKKAFGDRIGIFEHEEKPDGRPPVFLKHADSFNVLMSADISPVDRENLLGEIPVWERHRRFRSMSSSQAIALSVFGNLKIYGYLDLLSKLYDEHGQDEPGALPLMQFALKDLFDAQQAKGGVMALTLNDYLARGGLRQALERHADAAFARLNTDEQQLARTIFSALIEIGRGTQDTRRTAAFNELLPANADTTHVKAVVQKLADARLITTDQQGDRGTVTIAHERLIEAWPSLRKLINENREAISLQNQIAEDAQEWDEHQRDASYLYSGARLATAHEELAGQKIVLTELAQEFFTASVESEKSARQREKERHHLLLSCV